MGIQPHFSFSKPSLLLGTRRESGNENRFNEIRNRWSSGAKGLCWPFSSQCCFSNVFKRNESPEEETAGRACWNVLRMRSFS